MCVTKDLANRLTHKLFICVGKVYNYFYFKIKMGRPQTPSFNCPQTAIGAQPEVRQVDIIINVLANYALRTRYFANQQGISLTFAKLKFCLKVGLPFVFYLMKLVCWNVIINYVFKPFISFIIFFFFINLHEIVILIYHKKIKIGKKFLKA